MSVFRRQDDDGLTVLTRALQLGDHRPDLTVDGTIELDRLPDVLFIGRPASAQEQSVVGLFKLLPDGGAIDAAVWAGGFLASSHAMAARNQPLLRELAGARPLGVVSNFTGNLRPCLEELGLLDCFDVVLDSAEVGLRKPDARLFSIAFRAFAPYKQCYLAWVGLVPWLVVLKSASVPAWCSASRALSICFRFIFTSRNPLGSITATCCSPRLSYMYRDCRETTIACGL